MIYLIFKSLHIIFMVAWFAGMFYIWRLFVYHTETQDNATRNLFILMEKRLLNIIMTPAMILTVLFGLIMLLLQWDYFSKILWIWIKIVIVIFLIYWHYLAYRYYILLKKGQIFSSKKFRIMNEIPTLVLIVVVFLAILKPF